MKPVMGYACQTPILRSFSFVVCSFIVIFCVSGPPFCFCSLFATKCTCIIITLTHTQQQQLRHTHVNICLQHQHHESTPNEPLIERNLMNRMCRKVEINGQMLQSDIERLKGCVITFSLLWFLGSHSLLPPHTQYTYCKHMTLSTGPYESQSPNQRRDRTHTKKNINIIVIRWLGSLELSCQQPKLCLHDLRLSTTTHYITICAGNASHHHHIHPIIITHIETTTHTLKLKKTTDPNQLTCQFKAASNKLTFFFLSNFTECHWLWFDLNAQNIVIRFVFASNVGRQSSYKILQRLFELWMEDSRVIQVEQFYMPYNNISVKTMTRPVCGLRSDCVVCYVSVLHASWANGIFTQFGHCPRCDMV